MPTTITQTRTIAEGETVEFVDEAGFLLTPSAQPSLINHGTLIVRVGAELFPVFAIGHPYDYTGPTDFTKAMVVNEVGGVIQVTAPQSTAFGVYSNDRPAPDIFNRGTFVVSGLNAYGVTANHSDWGFSNSGTWRVVAEGSAYGLSVGNGAIDNSGLFEVEGAAGVGIRFVGLISPALQGSGTVTNSGTLRVTSTSHVPSIAILNEARGATVVNSGLIEADVAFRETITSNANAILNTGTLRGSIELLDGGDLIRNAGRIEGNITLGGGDDVYDGSAGTHTGAIYAGTGDDALVGGVDADVFFGGAGLDLINAGAGNDFVDGGDGPDALDGGAGFDTLSYETATQEVAVDLAAGTGNDTGRDLIRNFERVVGSAYDDAITGSGGADTLEGRAGADRLSGGAGTDTLIGGAGADTLTGGAGADAFVFSIGDGQDTVIDFKSGGDTDRLEIHGYPGYTELRQVGADTLVVLSPTDSILLKNVQASSLTAADFLFDAAPLATPPSPPPPADATSNVLTADLITGATDTIRLTGPVGRVLTSSRSDVPTPSIYNAGTLHLDGEAGVSVTGFLKPATGLGSASIIYNQSTGAIAVTAVGGSATGLSLRTSTTTVFNEGRITVSAEGGAAVGVASANASDFTLVNKGTLEVSGTDATGVIVNSNGATWNLGTIEVSATGAGRGVQVDSVLNFVNTGTIHVDAGGNGVGLYLGAALQGGSAFNTGVIEAEYAVQAEGIRHTLYNSGELRGRVSFRDEVNTDYETYGADAVYNTGTITGLVEMGGGADLFDGRTGTQSGGVNGEAGDDRLWGGAGTDTLDGGDGNDQLSGGKGANTLTGGAGADAFHFEAGFGSGTVITDFGVGGTDVIRVVGYTRYQSVQQQGADTLIVFSATDSLLLKNVQASSLTPASFQFSAAALGPAAAWPGPNAAPSAPTAPPVPVAPVTVEGASSADPLNGGTAAEAIFGRDGDDRIQGAGGRDQMFGGQGADTFVYSAGHGADVIYDFDAHQGDVLRLEGYSAYQTRNVGADLVVSFTDGGSITLRGGALTAAAGAIELGSPPGFTIKEGTAGADTLDGGSARDLLRGGADADILRGLEGNDRLEGGRGEDVLDGGFGVDDLVGGLGADVFVFRPGQGNDTIRDFSLAQGDRIRLEGFSSCEVQVVDGTVYVIGLLSGAHNIVLSLAGTSLAQVLAGIDLVPTIATAPTITGSLGGELLDGTSGGELMLGLRGADQIRGMAGGDVIDGGAGDDIVEGGQGNDDLTGGQGADVFVYRPGDGDDLIRDFNPAEGDQLRLEGHDNSGFPYQLRQNGNDVLVTFGNGVGSINLVNTTIGQAQSGIVGLSWFLTDYGWVEVAGTEANNTLTGGAQNEAMAGFGGTDTLTGAGGNDLLSGGAGSDTLNGGDGIDYLTGDEGTDTLTGGAGGDYIVIMPGSGTDTVTDFNVAEDVIDIRRTDVASITQQGTDTLLVFASGDRLILKNVSAAALKVTNFLGGAITPALMPPAPPATTGTPNADTLNGADNSDRILGLGGDDVLGGGASDDLLDGADGADRLDGGIGSDLLLGGAGDDILSGGSGADELDGGAGVDTASFADAAAAVTANLGTGSASEVGSGPDLLTSIENLVGSSYGDILRGDGGANALSGGAGDDLLDGGAGDDRLDGGAGSDTASFAGATSAVAVDLRVVGAQATGGAGTDTLIGVERLTGSAFADRLTGNSAANTLAGGNGDDQLEGGAGADRLDGGAGVDEARYVSAAAGVILNLTTGVHGGDAAGDTFVSIERFLLSGRDDQFIGSAGADDVGGHYGNDTLFGAAGDDLLDGGAGNDILRGGLGADRLIGGGGTDQANYQVATAAIALNLTTGVHTGEAAGDTFESIERFVLSGYGDQFTGSAGSDEAVGYYGNDVLFGAGGADKLDGGAGNDILRGGEGADQLIGGTGTDTSSYQLATAAVSLNLTTGVHGGEAAGDTFESVERFALSTLDDSFVGSSAADWVDGWKGNDVLRGEGGNDELHGNEGLDQLYGGTGNDKLYGDGQADDLYGDAGTDTLYGGTGADRLFGGDDGDFLWGEAGDDVLTGGAGADRFAFSTGSGRDVITDFQRGQDKIILKAMAGIDDFSDLTVTTDVNGWAVITWGDGSSRIALTGVAAGQLTASDVWFT